MTDGCGFHGWSYMPGCPDCEAAEDEAIWEQHKWKFRKMDYLPHRVGEYLGYDEETLELHLGPWEWRKPPKGPLSGRFGAFVVRLLSGRAAP